jgi:cytoskeletal protein RodZ
MPTIGETLKAARLQKGTPEETVAKVLKIKVDRVKDLEANKFDHFAAPVYVRSFIRHYASYLGIDGIPLVQQYEKEFPEPDRRPIFDMAEDTRAHTFIRHQPPAKAQGLALTSTGQAVLVAVFIFFVIGGIALWIIPKMPASKGVPQSTQDAQTNSVESSSPSTPVSSNTSSNSISNSSEPWNIPVQSHLDSALTFSTNAPPASIPGQAVHVP